MKEPLHTDDGGSFAEGGKAITFTVPGRPPSGKGVLGAGYKHRERTIALLEAARDEMKNHISSSGFGKAPVRLEVEVGSGPKGPPWDATNYLNAIADVLDGKGHKLIAQPGSLDHLGDLKDVAVYDDDRQIQEVDYRVVDHPQEQYLVTIRPLSMRD